MTLTTGTATSFITFTRASTAMRINASGALESVASNTPRLDFDPVTLAAKGLLVEEQRTNLLLNSATLSTQSVTVSATAYTLSFYGTGTITLSGTSTAGPLVGTGAFPTRVSLTFTPTAGTLTLTVSGSVTNAQLEAGSFPTSYIPTTSASVTRSADVASLATSSFPYSSTTGTVIINATPPNYPAATSGGINPTVFSLTDGTLNNRIMILRAVGTIDPTFRVSVAGADQALFAPATTGNWPNGATRTVAVAWAANDFAMSVNGGAVATDTSGTIPTVNVLSLGNIASGGLFNGYIRQITYIPRRLTNAELQARTA